MFKEFLKFKLFHVHFILISINFKNIMEDMNIKLLNIQTSFSRTTKYHRTEVFGFINYGDMHIYMWA